MKATHGEIKNSVGVGDFCQWLLSAANGIQQCSSVIENKGELYCLYHMMIWEDINKSD